MKAKQVVERILCDFCQTETHFAPCFVCQKDICQWHGKMYDRRDLAYSSSFREEDRSPCPSYLGLCDECATHGRTKGEA